MAMVMTCQIFYCRISNVRIQYLILQLYYEFSIVPSIEHLLIHKRERREPGRAPTRRKLTGYSHIVQVPPYHTFYYYEII